ncbi:MAG: helix-turn-helix transcriptional regulator [Bacteroidetes bacterium]|nr:helix-turn-helix transcriptional regulator [Bacteroidota bacterium]
MKVKTSTFKTIGANFRKLRLASGDRAETVGQAAGVSGSVISRIEHGRYPSLKVSLIEKAAAHFAVTVSYFFQD